MGWPSTCSLVSWFASPLVPIAVALLGGLMNCPGTIPEGCRVHVPRGTMTVSESLWACDKQGLRPKRGTSSLSRRTPPPCHSLTHSLTHARTHARTHALTHSRTHALTHSLSHSLIRMYYIMLQHSSVLHYGISYHSISCSICYVCKYTYIYTYIYIYMYIS